MNMMRKTRYLEGDGDLSALAGREELELRRDWGFKGRGVGV